jgi:hypothetical protein
MLFPFLCLQSRRDFFYHFSVPITVARRRSMKGLLMINGKQSLEIWEDKGLTSIRHDLVYGSSINL